MTTLSLAALTLTLSLAPQGTPPWTDAEWQQHLGDPREVLGRWFAAEVETVARADRERARLRSAEDRAVARRQLCEMLGLPSPSVRPPLRVTVTGTLRQDELGIAVDKLHFQSLPGLYVTANLYRPSRVDPAARLPAILYLCGHGKVKRKGISYGNKTYYQHHPTWFAQHGFVCLVVDTLQLGEIEGAHHGTYRLNQWWWVRRGYTPAGVETWNSIRALDLLCARDDVDARRIGVTGRSGGGIGTWYLAAVDERPAVLAPVAGLTDLRDHVLTGCIEGHCDCNYVVNSYRWDAYTVACLAAPRPLLLCNSDRDKIFPLPGVMRLHAALQRVYTGRGAGGKLGLQITNGPHQDTQDLRVPVFRWMQRWLQGAKDPLVEPARKHFEVEQLRVLAGAPGDQRNTRIQEEFVPVAAPVPSPHGSSANRETVLQRIRDVVFRSARRPTDCRLQELRRRVHGAITCAERVLETGDVFRLPVQVWTRSSGAASRARVRLEIVERLSADLTDPSARRAVAQGELVLVQMVPRGLGPTAWGGKVRERNHLRRRCLILGRPLDQARVHDVRAAIRAVQADLQTTTGVDLVGRGRMGELALFAAILDPLRVARVDLHALPQRRDQHLTLLGINRVVADADLGKLLPATILRLH